MLVDDGQIIGARDPDGFRPLCLGRLDDGWVLASETPALDIVGRRAGAGAGTRRDRGHRRRRPPQHPHGAGRGRSIPHLCLFEFVYFARPDAQLYGNNVAAARARMGELLAEQAPLAPDHAAPRAPGDGDAGARERRAGGPGLRPRQRHPLRRRPGEEPLHRPHLHRAQPGAAGPQRPAQAQPAARRHRRPAPRRGRRLDRAGHHHPRRGHHAARGGRRRGAPADHVAAVPLAVLLRHGHRRPRRAAGVAAERGRDPRRTSAPTPSPTSASIGSSPPPARRVPASATPASPATTRCRCRSR